MGKKTDVSLFDGPFHHKQVFNVGVAVEIVDLLFCAACGVKFVFVTKKRDLVRREANAERAEVIGILPI